MVIYEKNEEEKKNSRTGNVEPGTVNLPTRYMRMDFESRNDGDLLREFAQTGNEAPFTEVVRRYENVVLAECRRVTGNAQDAEDTAQAVFLMLVRKAKSLRKRHSVGAWLHHVARNLSLTARRAKERRKVRENEGAEMMVARQEERRQQSETLERLMDEGLDRIPEKYRVPLILHYLEGLSQDEAAQRSGVKVETFYKRLSRGRELLRKRLAGGGLALGAPVLITLLTEQAEASAVAVPEHFAAVAAKAAKAVVMGELADAAGIVSNITLTMSKGGLRVMLYKKLAIAGVAAATVMGGVVVPVVVGNGKDKDQAVKKPNLSLSIETQPQVNVEPVYQKPPSVVTEKNGRRTKTLLRTKRPSAPSAFGRNVAKKGRRFVSGRLSIKGEDFVEIKVVDEAGNETGNVERFYFPKATSRGKLRYIRKAMVEKIQSLNEGDMVRAHWRKTATEDRRLRQIVKLSDLKKKR